MQKMLVVLAVLGSVPAFAQETEKSTVVISSVGGATVGGARSQATWGALAGFYRDEGSFRYGATAIGTSGQSQWAGGALEGRWVLGVPYLGLGIGAFAARRDGVDLGVRATATAEAGIELGRFFSGVRVLLPLTSRDGVREVTRTADLAVLGQVGFRL